MEVLALRAGFYREARIREGSRFHLDSADDISCIWHQPLDKEAQEAFESKEKEMKAAGIDIDLVKEDIVNVVTHKELKHGERAPGTLKNVNQMSTHASKGSKKVMKKTTQEKLPKAPHEKTA